MRLFLFFTMGSVLLVVLLFLYVAFSYWLMCRRLGVSLRGGFSGVKRDGAMFEGALGYRFAVEGSSGDVYEESRCKEAVSEDEVVIDHDEHLITDLDKGDPVVGMDEECAEKSFVVEVSGKDVVQDGEVDNVVGLEQGVDDCIQEDVKPVDSRLILWQGSEYTLPEFREVLESMKVGELRRLYFRLSGSSGSSLKKIELVVRILESL